MVWIAHFFLEGEKEKERRREGEGEIEDFEYISPGFLLFLLLLPFLSLIFLPVFLQYIFDPGADLGPDSLMSD